MVEDVLSFTGNMTHVPLHKELTAEADAFHFPVQQLSSLTGGLQEVSIHQKCILGSINGLIQQLTVQNQPLPAASLASVPAWVVSTSKP